MSDREALKMRMQRARQLQLGGQLEDALPEYLWVWEHMLEIAPAMVGVRHSFLANDLEELIAKHPPARDAFTKLRDALAPPTDRAPDESHLPDWFTLNRVLHDGAATLRWYDAIDKRLIVGLERHWKRHVMPLLVKQNRWAEIGAFSKDPLGELDAMFEHGEERIEDVGRRFSADHAEALAKLVDQHTRSGVSVLVRALRAAGRGNEADAVAAEARRRDPSDEMEKATR